MNYIQTKRPTSPNWQTSLIFALLLHIILLGGLYYLNSDNPRAIFPTFLTEWLGPNAEVDP